MPDAYELGLTLNNTLQGLDPLTLMQAEAVRQQQELAARTQAATQGAQQAQQAYQQAAAAPPPQLPMADAFVPALLGNLASVISQNPAYQQQGQEQVQQSKAELLKARADNLQALRDAYSQKADEAAKAGDLEAQITARTKMDTFSKLHDEVMANHDREFKAEQANLDRQSAERIASERKANSMGGGGMVDPSAIADGIEQGILPPEGTNLGRGGTWAAVSSLLAKRGFNVKQAQNDLIGTRAHFRNLNSTQQLRLRTAAQTAYQSLDLIDQMSAELSQKLGTRGGVPIFNKASMTAAMQGAFGPEAQIAANNLNIQIGDLQAEIAQVFRGGYAPTNEALKQAEKQLRGEWSEATLKAASQLARQNLRIRLNSLNQVGPITTQSGAGTEEGSTGNIQPTGNLVEMIDDKGKRRTIDAAEVPDAIAKGKWKRAPVK
jgi:hypothetical protein